MKNNEIETINIDALKRLPVLFNNINTTDETEKAGVNMRFYDYGDQMNTLGHVIKAIQNLSLTVTHNSVSDEDNIDKQSTITALCDVAKQLIPNNEMEFIDDLIFNNQPEHQDIRPLNKL